MCVSQKIGTHGDISLAKGHIFRFRSLLKENRPETSGFESLEEHLDVLGLISLGTIGAIVTEIIDYEERLGILFGVLLRFEGIPGEFLDSFGCGGYVRSPKFPFSRLRRA